MAVDEPTKNETMKSRAPSAPAPKTGAGAPDLRRLRGEASAQRIIDATILLIAQEGIAKVTMQRIATEIGSSNALVVFHFQSKENLFRAVLQYLSDQYEQTWQNMVHKSGLTPAQRLLAAIDCAQYFARLYPHWVSVWVAFSSDRSTRQLDRLISLPNDIAYNAESRAIIDEIARTGAYPDVDTVTLAEGLNYLVQGAWYWDNLNPEGIHPGAMRKTALTLLSRVFPRHFSVTE